MVETGSLLSRSVPQEQFSHKVSDVRTPVHGRCTVIQVLHTEDLPHVDFIGRIGRNRVVVKQWRSRRCAPRNGCCPSRCRCRFPRFNLSVIIEDIGLCLTMSIHGFQEVLGGVPIEGSGEESVCFEKNILTKRSDCVGGEDTGDEWHLCLDRAAGVQSRCGFRMRRHSDGARVTTTRVVFHTVQGSFRKRSTLDLEMTTTSNFDKRTASGASQVPPT